MRVATWTSKLGAAARAVAAADPTRIEQAARELGESRRLLAPLAWAAGTILLLLRGIKLLILNWRLSLLQLVPAAWVWLVMWNLKQHALRGSPFREFTPAGTATLFAITLAVSVIAFWCNTVFAFAIDTPPPPRIRPAMRQARAFRRKIVTSGLLLGSALGAAALVVPRLDLQWLYVLVLGSVLGLMLISFVAVPARIIGVHRERLPPKEAVGRLAVSGALSAVAMAPGFILDRIGLILLGVSGLRLLGFVLLSVGTALYAAGMSSVKAVKLAVKLTDTEAVS